ncbi:hypothetical protein [Rivularia sp. UHCC 0363]|uniref:hypothetical protein n=1 Tax=Rivularia sp. UHCC 0363 TaxID=3110244 RepID=UPI002B2182BA|nr:hypothetical protein [Rivularia sp. UHCC 0363]MEA5599125.1 hypothetical protein [Rivularia sp. UHCC 0363]
MNFAITPRLKKLLITAGLLGMFSFVWSFVIIPQIFPDVACIVSTPSGEFVKAWGKADCMNNEKAVIVLQAD